MKIEEKWDRKNGKQGLLGGKGKKTTLISNLWQVPLHGFKHRLSE